MMANSVERSAAAEAMRRRNLRTGWLLAGVALCLALSIWYSRVA